MSEDSKSLRTTPSLLERYRNSASIRALLQLIPFGLGSAADTGLSVIAERVRAERARVFFDELAKEKTLLTDELIRSEEFLHCFYLTSNAALRTRRHEKICLFARLLSSSFKSSAPRDIDEFEELSAILDEITHREWMALLILDRYSDRPRGKGDHELKWSMTFWNEFCSDIERELEIPEPEITPFMNRIGRTGLYYEITGAFWDYEGGIGILTERFHRLKRFVSERPF